MRRFIALAVVATVPLALLSGGASGSQRQFRIAYVTDVVAQPNPHDLRGVALQGFERAVKQFAVQGRVVQFDPRLGAGPTLTSLARQNYDLVLMGEVQSGLDVNAFLTTAKRFPKTTFVFTDPPFQTRWPKNVQGSLWRVEQPAYLAGYLAGLMEKRRPGRDVIGSVGGFEIPTVNAFMAGFQAGASKADPGITALRKYAQSFFAAAKCRRIARDEIAKGAGVVLNVAGVCGLGTMQAAQEHGVWGVGVDVDQSYLGPHVLTSVLKRFDVQVYETIKALTRDTLRTGATSKVWDLRNGAVGLGKISPKVPQAFFRQLESIRKQIIAGKIKVPSALQGQ
jgi:basic membrane protein A